MAASRWVKMRRRTVGPREVVITLSPSWRLKALVWILRTAAWAVRRL
jgi:hypothetical protein